MDTKEGIVKDAIKKVIDKTIKRVIVNEGAKAPQSQVFFVFYDNANFWAIPFLFNEYFWRWWD